MWIIHTHGQTRSDWAPARRRHSQMRRAEHSRKLKVPEGTEPLEVDHYVPTTTPPWQGSKQLMDENHQPIYYTEEWYETSTGDIIVFQDHHFGHQKPGEPGTSLHIFM